MTQSSLLNDFSIPHHRPKSLVRHDGIVQIYDAIQKIKLHQWSVEADFPHRKKFYKILLSDSHVYVANGSSIKKYSITGEVDTWTREMYSTITAMLIHREVLYVGMDPNKEAEVYICVISEHEDSRLVGAVRVYFKSTHRLGPVTNPRLAS